MPNLKSSLDFLPILWNFLILDESAIFGFIPELVEFKSLLGKTFSITVTFMCKWLWPLELK